MTTELTLLAWTLVLAIAQIILAAALRTQEVGLVYNASPRDTPAAVPPRPITGRLIRAQQNLFETLPLFIAAILIVQVANLNGPITTWGAALYFWARVLYMPLYALGIPLIRTLVWMIGVVGLIMLLVVILHAA
jgi:uncharacterized MAPEG superfamily protein